MSGVAAYGLMLPRHRYAYIASAAALRRRDTPLMLARRADDAD